MKGRIFFREEFSHLLTNLGCFVSRNDIPSLLPASVHLILIGLTETMSLLLLFRSLSAIPIVSDWCVVYLSRFQTKSSVNHSRLACWRKESLQASHRLWCCPFFCTNNSVSVVEPNLALQSHVDGVIAFRSLRWELFDPLTL